jgi:hypothetical protein
MQELDDLMLGLIAQHVETPNAALPFISRLWRKASSRMMPVECQRDLCASAASRGHLEMLKWMHANGCPWDRWTCAAAAVRGHLDVLKWARSNGCPWDKSTCALAAKGGHLEALQWARTNGCPWDARTCKYAADKGHFEVLTWAHSNGCPLDRPYLYGMAVGDGRVDILRWLESVGHVQVP